MTDLTGAEKAANAQRVNAYQDMAKAFQDCVNAAGGNVNMLELIHTFKQLQVSFEVLVDLLLENRLVRAVPNPEAPQGAENPAPSLDVSTLTREEYWKRCAQRAELEASGFRKQLLSGSMITPSVKRS